MTRFISEGNPEMEAFLQDFEVVVNKHLDKLTLTEFLLCMRTAYVGMFCLAKEPRKVLSNEIEFLQGFEESRCFDDYMKRLYSYNIEQNGGNE
jgi:hypothetical protein